MEPPHQFDSPLFDSARAALSADFSAVASPQFTADVPATHPASSEQARNPVSPAVAADYENLAGLYQKLIDSSSASSPAPEPVELPVIVFKVRKKTAGSWAEQRRTTETARRAVGFVEQAVDSVACVGTPAADAYEGKFTKLTMLVAEMVKKDPVFKASCENFEVAFDVKTGNQATRLVDEFIHMLLNQYGFTDEQAQASAMLIATRKARSGSTGRKNADITALLVRSYLTASEDDLGLFNSDAHGWILSQITDRSGREVHVSVGLRRLMLCYAEERYYDEWDRLVHGWFTVLKVLRVRAPSGVAAKTAYVLSVANDGSSRRPQDQQVHPDGSMEAVISVLSRDKDNYEDMISEGKDADLDLSLKLYDRCKQVTFCMLPEFRAIMKELVDDQKRTANRIRMVDSVPNCKSWPQFLLLLTRGQEVVTDRDVKVVRGKPAAKQPSAGTPAGPKDPNKQCKYEKKQGHCTRGGTECYHGKHLKPATHKIPANNGNRKPKAGVPAPLPKDQASMPLGGLSSDETFTPCEGDPCDKQIGYDKVEFDKKGWSTPKWCHGCKKIRNAARLAANSAGPGSSAGGGNSNLAVMPDEPTVDSDEELSKSLVDADGSKTVHFELFGAGNLAIGEITDQSGYDSDDMLANSVDASSSRKAMFHWSDLPSEACVVVSDTTLKAPECDKFSILAAPAGTVVESAQQSAARRLRLSLEAAELTLGSRAGAGDNGLPVLSNTTLELTFTGADTLDPDTADSFAIPSTDGHGETLEELNSQCPWIDDCGEVGACAMLAEVEPGLKLCNACGDPPDQSGLCDGECWSCFVQKQTAVVEELCKPTTLDPAPCDHPSIFCEAGNVMVDYVENYWCPDCGVKIDLDCAPDCNECCKQPCGGPYPASGSDSESSSLSSGEEYVLVPKDLTDELNGQVSVQLCTACGSKPDEDGYCDGICYSCYLSLHDLDEQLPNSQDDETAYDAALHSATACGACGIEAAGDLDDGICSSCQQELEKPTTGCAIWKQLTKEKVSELILQLCSTGSVAEPGSYANLKVVDGVLCVMSKLDTTKNEFWHTTTAALVQSLQAITDDVLPTQYAEEELEVVFFTLLTEFSGWTPKVSVDWASVFSSTDTGALIVDCLVEAKPVLLLDTAGALCGSLKSLVDKASCCNSDLVALGIDDADTRATLHKSCAKVAKVIVSNAIRSPKTMWQVARGRLDVQAKCKTAMGKLRADLEKECVATLKTSKSSKMIVFSRSSVKMHAQELIEWLVEEDLQAVAKGLVKFSKARLVSNFAATCDGTQKQLALMQAQKNPIGNRAWPKLFTMRRSTGMQRTIQAAFKKAEKLNTAKAADRQKFIVTVRDADGLVMASHSPGGFVSVPSGKVKLTGSSAEDMTNLLCQAAALASKMTALEIFAEDLQWVGQVGPDSDVVSFLCQLTSSCDEMELSSRWMWQTGDEWLDTACLAIYFREALGNLRVIPFADAEDPLLKSAGSASSNVSDSLEYADRVINASNGIWVTDKTRKSRRAKRAPVKLVQSPTGIQREVLSPVEFAAAGETDEDDLSNSSSDFH